jgi:hypothetical protein
MSTDGPQPTQGAPKKKRKKEGKSVGCFLGLFFCPLFSFSFFWTPLGTHCTSSHIAHRTNTAACRLPIAQPLRLPLAAPVSIASIASISIASSAPAVPRPTRHLPVARHQHQTPSCISTHHRIGSWELEQPGGFVASFKGRQKKKNKKKPMYVRTLFGQD